MFDLGPIKQRCEQAERRAINGCGCVDADNLCARCVADDFIEEWNIPALIAEVERLRGEYADLLNSAFRAEAHQCDDGWWDTMAIGSVKMMGDELVELGLWERQPGGVGRRWFYRPVKKE